ncbi:class E sortase [Thermomonospora umbrina]|uniref:LPXTG-site transpeptidase (Sortase) family protein n=1 Tax=Thermomonospora umbrina TaxID=111806 RepID=A0A3D9SP84_9ACTN|nr:class E sortase [Thermomonospora umbrina]REE97718.1 LPXTG-site transpeptidase (sortase) family protein [Thermomonospora umbrina]
MWRRALVSFVLAFAVVAEPIPGAAATTPIAMLEIPRIDPPGARPVLEGVSAKTLAAGVGHHPETAPPGEPGNTVLLGHRTLGPAPFHDLDRLRPGDVIRLYGSGFRLAYRVESTRITSPRDRGIVAPVPFTPSVDTDQHFLTLVTCHPKGSDRYRLVVVGRTVPDHGRFRLAQT